MINKTFPVAQKLIGNGLTLVNQLRQLLEEEADYLKKGSQQIELLNSLVEKKQPLIAQINQFSKQMSQVLATESLPNDQNGIAQYLAKAKAVGLNINLAQHDWTEISTASMVCRDLNEQNGACIDILRKHTQRSLQILKGGSQTPVTYGKDGITKSNINSRSLFSV